MINLYFQVPPTPTPVPPPEVFVVEIPNAMFWDSAPEVVGLWNQMNQSYFFTLVQVLAVGILVVLFLGVLFRAIRQISR